MSARRCLDAHAELKSLDSRLPNDALRLIERADGDEKVGEVVADAHHLAPGTSPHSRAETGAVVFKCLIPIPGILIQRAEIESSKGTGL